MARWLRKNTLLKKLRPFLSWFQKHKFNYLLSFIFQRNAFPCHLDATTSQPISFLPFFSPRSKQQSTWLQWCVFASVFYLLASAYFLHNQQENSTNYNNNTRCILIANSSAQERETFFLCSSAILILTLLRHSSFCLILVLLISSPSFPNTPLFPSTLLFSARSSTRLSLFTTSFICPFFPALHTILAIHLNHFPIFTLIFSVSMSLIYYLREL